MKKKELLNKKLFVYKKRFYLYDPYSNYLFEIKKKIYENLNKGLTSDLNELIDKKFILENPIKRIEHPFTKYLSYMLDRSLNEIILEVTQICNLKCRYCQQSENGIIEPKNMSFETAKKAIDFLYKKSIDSTKISITFYGGEPLLNFSLIKKVVEYAKSLFFYKELNFNLTTNATLLNDEMINFFINNKFYLMFSIDGDETIDNLHRKYKINGTGSFHEAWGNIDKLKKIDNSYFNKYVRFNSVILPGENVNSVIGFYKSNNIENDKVAFNYADLKGIDFVNNVIENDDSYIKNKEFEKFLKIFNDKGELYYSWHHNGPCIPGIRRFFVDINENIYTCEKILKCNNSLIGSLDKGLDYKKIKNILNIGEYTCENCKKCWALRFCSFCIKDCLDYKGNINKNLINNQCMNNKKNALDFLKKYISLKENINA